MVLIPEEHYHNRAHIPAAELAKYYGKDVAWSLDGTQIVASADDPRKVCAAVKQAGLASDEVVLSYVPFPEETIHGNVWMLQTGDQE